MPAYNEADNIEATIAQWYPVVENTGADCRLVIANDGSKDKTYEIMKSLERKYPQLIALDKPNQGHGPTVIWLYKYAIDHGAEYIFQTDSDGQTNPAEFRQFLKASADYDCEWAAGRYAVTDMTEKWWKTCCAHTYGCSSTYGCPMQTPRSGL